MAKPTNDPLLQSAEEALRLSVSEQLDTLRLQRELSVERTAKGAQMSKQAVLDVLKTNSDLHLSTLIRLALVVNARVRLILEPL